MSWKVIVCSIAIIFGGCPKRHAGPRIVYIPAPPPAASPSESTQAIVVQGPAPSVPAKVPPAPAPPVAHKTVPIKHAHHRVPQTRAPKPEPANVPALQSGISPRRETELRDDVVNLQREIEKKISRLSQEQLSQSQQDTLDGARGFLQQSQRALQQSDLQRASNLAHKADLLVISLQQSQ